MDNNNNQEDKTRKEGKIAGPTAVLEFDPDKKTQQEYIEEKLQALEEEIMSTFNKFHYHTGCYVSDISLIHKFSGGYRYDGTMLVNMDIRFNSSESWKRS